MLMTVFDPNQFGGRFFYTTAGFPNVFTDLGQINRPVRTRNSRSERRRPVEERFNDLTRIVQCLVLQLRMPIYPREQYPAFQSGYDVKHLLDYYREIGSWMAFAVLLQYFRKLDNSQGYHHNIVTGAGDLSMFRPGVHVNADLPFILSKLRPYISQQELQEAKNQFSQMTERITGSPYLTATSDSAILPILSEKFHE